LAGREKLVGGRTASPEPLVGTDRDLGRVIEDPQLSVIEVAHLLEILEHLEEKVAVPGLQLIRFDLEVLVRIRRSVDPGTHQKPQPSHSEKVGEEPIDSPVPREKKRAGGSLSIQLRQLQRLPGTDLELRLQDSSRPQEPDEIHLIATAEAEQERLR